MIVTFADPALRRLDGILTFIEADSVAAAKRVASRIHDAAEKLVAFPEMGRSGLVPGTREWVIPGLPYILVYEIDHEADRLVILNIVHGAQDRPGS